MAHTFAIPSKNIPQNLEMRAGYYILGIYAMPSSMLYDVNKCFSVEWIDLTQKELVYAKLK